MLVTFDLFSALIDSRSGASAVLDRLSAERGWPVDGTQLHDVWDAHNKASQRDEPEWIPFAEHCRRALAAAYADLALDGEPAGDAATLLDSVGRWPLWPDVPEGLPLVADRVPVGVLSNVDDDVFARTPVGRLVGEVMGDDAVLTSERLRAYKPSPAVYVRARERAGGQLMHVASSARDVRGALEAGLDVVRLRRPGHRLDPDGPSPEREIDDLRELPGVLGGGIRSA